MFPKTTAMAFLSFTPCSWRKETVLCSYSLQPLQRRTLGLSGSFIATSRRGVEGSVNDSGMGTGEMVLVVKEFKDTSLIGGPVRRGETEKVRAVMIGASIRKKVTLHPNSERRSSPSQGQTPRHR